MQIKLRPETGKLLRDQMSKGHCEDADAMVRLALETLQQVESESIEELDAETQASVARGEEQASHGEGRPWEEVKRELRKKLMKA